MNLYRSFGNLLEAWVAEGGPYSDSESVGNNDEDSPTPSSDMGTNLRSESVDSGVETASSDTSFPAASCFVSGDNAEIDAFTPGREGEGLTPASTSQSPVLSSPMPSSSSSSSPCLCPSRTQEGTSTLLPKVEHTPQRTDSKLQKDASKPLAVEEVLRRRPRASFIPKRHSSELVRGQRSETFGLRRTADPSAPSRQMSEMCRRPMSVNFDKRKSEETGVGERNGLSPGLSYLEEVCQMLEEIARHQIHNRTPQMEVEALRERPYMQAPDTCQGDSPAAEEDFSSCQTLENRENAEHSSTKSRQQKEKTHRHFRQRSASDTTMTTLHLRKVNSNCRGQHRSTDDLLETNEEEKEESKKEVNGKTSKSWRLKIGSLRRDFSSLKETKGQQMQSSEKNSARRRLSQLFRRRRKTLPA